MFSRIKKPDSVLVKLHPPMENTRTQNERKTAKQSNDRRLKALILTTHTGGGHDAAAAALCEALTLQGVECRVQDCLAFGGAWLSKAVSGCYIKMVQGNPNHFGRLYRLGEIISTPRFKSPVYLFNATYAARMEALLAEFQPDMVVCTHMFGGQSMTHLRRRCQYKGLLAMVMTDYTFSPFMEDIQPDVLCVSHRAILPECRKKGLPENVLKPFGIPVSLGCTPCEDRAAAKSAAGLDPMCQEVLLVGGSMGAGNLPDTVAKLLPALQSAHLTVVCGSNIKAKEQCDALCANLQSVTVLGKVHPLYPLMSAADVLITKSGGLTTSEAMTIGVPMVIVHPIRGCETANADFFERYGLASYARSLDDLPRRVCALLEDQEAARAMVEAQHREIDPHAALHFASALIRMTREYAV